MSHFYGVIKGTRGEATRCGAKSSGLKTTAASWSGAIVTVLYNEGGVDMYRVEQRPWNGQGVSRIIAEGKVGE